jgi:hypothetical protein
VAPTGLVEQQLVEVGGGMRGLPRAFVRTLWQSRRPSRILLASVGCLAGSALLLHAADSKTTGAGSAGPAAPAKIQLVDCGPDDLKVPRLVLPCNYTTFVARERVGASVFF